MDFFEGDELASLAIAAFEDLGFGLDGEREQARFGKGGDGGRTVA